MLSFMGLSQASFSYLSHMKTNPLTLYVDFVASFNLVVIKRIEKFVKGSLLLKHMVEGIFFIYWAETRLWLVKHIKPLYVCSMVCTTES